MTAHRQGFLCLIVCLAVVTSAELSGRFFLNLGFLEQDKSLQKDLTNNLGFLHKKQPDLWLLGNSTLEFIINSDTRTIAETPIITITHGGATLQGSAALLDYYLRRSPAIPERVAVFIIKDDVNANGLNAQTSKHYLEFMTWKKYFRWNYSPLRSARRDIFQKIANCWSNLFVSRADRAEWSNKYFSLKWGTIDPKIISQRMMHNFQFEAEGFELLACVCNRHGVQNTSVVLLPVSTSYALWHDRLYPRLTYNDIRQKISLSCERNGLDFIDLAEPLGKEYFKDFFHVNEHGSIHVMNQITYSLKRRSGIPHEN